MVGKKRFKMLWKVKQLGFLLKDTSNSLEQL